MSLEVGQSAELTRRYSIEDVRAYTELGGHRCPYGVVPEPLIEALFSYLLGVKLPGIGTNYLKQESTFTDTALLDEPLKARVEVIRVRPEKHLVDLTTTCQNADGALICDGRALVYVRDVDTGWNKK